MTIKNIPTCPQIASPKLTAGERTTSWRKTLATAAALLSLPLAGCAPALATPSGAESAPFSPIVATVGSPAAQESTATETAASRSETGRDPIDEPQADAEADDSSEPADDVTDVVVVEDEETVIDDGFAIEDAPVAVEPAPAPVIAEAIPAHCEATPEFDADADWLDIAIEFITAEEGFDKNWVDIGDGMWTIGYGHAVQKSEPKDVSGPLTQEEAADLLRQDLQEMSYIPAVDNWFEEDLNDVTYAMMVSFAYNTGPRGFSKYDIPKEDVAAIAEAIEHASDHHSKKFPGLICRRAREAYLIRDSLSVAM